MRRSAAIQVVFASGALLAPGGRIAAEEQVWQRAPLHCPDPARRAPACGGGLVATDAGIWIAFAAADERGVASARVQQLNPRVPRVATPPIALPGATQLPRIAVLPDGRPVVFTAELSAGQVSTYRANPQAAAAGAWASPQRGRLRTRDGLEALGQPVVTRGGTLLLPLVRRTDTGSAIACFTSRDVGRTWREAGSVHAPAASDPVALEADSELVLVFRAGSRLLSSRSNDEGTTWDPPADTGIESDAVPHALAFHPGRVTLVWTEAADTALAPPALHGLRRAVSTDAGRSWQRRQRLLLHPGRVPVAAGLAGVPDGLALLLEESSGTSEPHDESTRALSCRIYSVAELDRLLPAPESASGRYALDTLAARAALRVLSAHTLHRPRRASRLFVEAYFMRSLVAAHAVLEPLGLGRSDAFDTRAGLAQAIAWADTLAATQAFNGFWPLGYGARYFADMAAAVALFPALEPWVDETRRGLYERAAARFLAGLERDLMFLDNGAVGVGREFGADPTRLPGRSRQPYVVGTALAGIEAQAWLYRRTQRPEYRNRALAALEYTLAQIGPDGFRETLARQEGSLRVSAYVEEGWMAADAFLDDESVRTRLQRALPAHVNWLLRSQRPDGTWDGGEKGGFARTPGIVDFLIWYDQRCEARQDVRAAVRRASAPLLDPERWPAYGLFRNGLDHEVLRALAGRPLAALAAERFVP